MIQIDKHYYYKGNEYVVTGFCKVKTTSGEWVDGVSYKKASEESTEIYVRDKEAFEYYFIPTTLEVGDIIIAISMGKVVAEYEVTSIDSESSQATAKSPSGIDLIVNTAVDSDAVVTKVEGGVPYQADYYYQLADMKKRMTNSTIIDKMVSELSNAVTRVQDIPVSYPTFNLQESLKSIHQTLDAIYNRYGV